MSSRSKKSVCKNPECGKKFKHHSSSYGYYCSSACHGRHKRIKSIELFKAGKLTDKSRRVIREVLKEVRGWHCELCNIAEWCGQPIQFIVDHIDGNYKNNQPSNLRLICHNCDSQLPTYKNRNRGSGRTRENARRNC